MRSVKKSSWGGAFNSCLVPDQIGLLESCTMSFCPKCFGSLYRWISSNSWCSYVIESSTHTDHCLQCGWILPAEIKTLFRWTTLVKHAACIKEVILNIHLLKVVFLYLMQKALMYTSLPNILYFNDLLFVWQMLMSASIGVTSALRSASTQRVVSSVNVSLTSLTSGTQV